MEKQDIIDTAFHVWGEHNFTHMSLAPLAEALNVSKTALYRYFKNKDDLLFTMKEKVVSEYAHMLDNFLQDKTYTSQSEGVATFFSVFFNEILNNSNHFSFFLLFISPWAFSLGANDIFGSTE